MSTDEFGWLLVRAVGAFLLLLIALDLVSIASLSLQTVVLRGKIDEVPFDSEEFIRLVVDYTRLIDRVVYLGIEMVFKTALAIYCFYRGELLKRLLVSRLPFEEGA